MIQAAMKRALDALIKETENDERKLEELESELSTALGDVRNKRFKLRQDNFKALRSFVRS